MVANHKGNVKAMKTPSGDTQQTIDALKMRVQELEAELAGAQKYGQKSEYYQVLFHNMQHEVHVWELVYENERIVTWRLIDANEVALTAWHKRLEDIVGQETDTIFGNGTSQLFMPIVEKIFTENKPYSWEQYFDATGQTLSMTSIPCEGYFISTGVDITDIHQAEQALRDTVLKLQEAIAAGNIGLWDWDLLTNETYFSPEWKGQLGYEPSEINNEFAEWETRVHPEDLPATLKKIQKTLVHAEDYHEVEFRMRHKNGTYRWILAHASMIKDDTGKPIRLVGSHIDITERKKLEAAALQQQKLQALGTLAGGIAHDFNNLLTPILGYAQLIKTKLPKQPEVEKYLSHIEDSAGRAKALIRQILLMSRESVENIEPVYLDKLVTEVTTLLKNNASDIQIEQEFEDELPAIGADSSEIYRVILNLCTNAMQAMPEGGVLSITVNTCQRYPAAGSKLADDYVCLRIKDTGTGMNAETLSRIFEPFYTTKLKGEERGSGLGLSIVDSLIKQLNGHIDVNSEPEKGTEFILYFPVVPKTGNGATDSLHDMRSVEGTKILLVEDEAAILELGESVLRHLGCEVTAFSNAEDALEHLNTQSQYYDVIISDYAMPEMSGVAFLRALRARGWDTPVIITTGFTDKVTDETRVLLKCESVLAKPYSLNELRAAISSSLSAIQAQLP